MNDTKILHISDRPSYIGMAIGLPFIFLSFLAYALLSLRHGHAKALLSYLASFFAMYLFYVVANYFSRNQHVSFPLCLSVVLVVVYFTFATYLWMNVLCFDCWRHLGDAVGYWDKISDKKRQRFWLYSAFAWSAALFLALLSFAVSKSVAPNVWYNPGLADDNCWFNDGIPVLIYLHLPVTVTIVANVVFLTLIARKLKEGDDTKRKKMKYKFVAFTQLFLILFFVWLIEITTWAIVWTNGSAPNGYWYFVEVFNATIGFLTFVVCIFKKTLYTLMQKRFQEIKRDWRKKYHMGTMRRFSY